MRHLATILLAIAATGCGQAPPVPEDSFYRLPEVVARTGEEPLVDGLVLVRTLQTDGLHSERAIIFAEGPEALSLKRYHYHLWLASPPRLLRDYLVEHLRAAGLASLVVTDPATPAEFVVSGRIKRLEQHLEGDASSGLVALELRVERRGDRRPLVLRDYRADVPVEGKSVAAAVAALAQGLDRTIGEFLDDTRAALTRLSETPSPRASR